MEYNNLSKDELIFNIPKTAGDLIKSKYFNKGSRKTRKQNRIQFGLLIVV